MVHSIVVVVRRVGTYRSVRIIRTVGGTLLAGVGGTLLVAVTVTWIVGVILRATILLGTVVWTAKDLVRQSDILHSWRVVRRLGIGRESLTFVRREGIRGAMLR